MSSVFNYKSCEHHYDSNSNEHLLKMMDFGLVYNKKTAAKKFDAGTKNENNLKFVAEVQRFCQRSPNEGTTRWHMHLIESMSFKISVYVCM